MGAELARVVAKLSKALALRVGGQDGLMQLGGGPAAHRGAAVEEDFQQARHPGVVNLAARKYAWSRVARAELGAESQRREG